MHGGNHGKLQIKCNNYDCCIPVVHRFVFCLLNLEVKFCTMQLKDVQNFPLHLITVSQHRKLYSNIHVLQWQVRERMRLWEYVDRTIHTCVGANQYSNFVISGYVCNILSVCVRNLIAYFQCLLVSISYGTVWASFLYCVHVCSCSQEDR